MPKKPILYVVIAVVLIIGLSSALFTVQEYQQALVLQGGRPVRILKEPGLHGKIPILQNVEYFDKRVLEYDASARPIITKDKKTLVVDNYAKWRIIDPLKFRQAVRDERGAQSRLDDIIYSELRVDLARKDLIEIVATDRAKAMQLVTRRTDEKAREYGIQVVDVRIKRADLPPENEKAIFGRMKAERQREARKYRSEGQEEALKIRAQTDKEKAILLAEAYQKEQEVRGEGDAKAIVIYAEAFEQDSEFYGFLRTLEAYKKSLKTGTTLLLPPQSEFLEHLFKK
ncbi:MAG: protease modulator HflC [Nitrospinota bacterium]